MSSDGGGGIDMFMARLWSLVVLAIVGSIAAELVMEYVVPLLPYALAVAAVALAAYVAVAWKRRW